MTKVFLTSDQLEVKSGYLSVKGDKMAPVTNEAFIAAQKHAEYIITFAEKAKGKDFKGKCADSLSSLKADVIKELASKTKKFVNDPEKPKQVTTEKLTNEALAFIGFAEESTKTDKINKFLAQFEIIDEFEEIGLFFNSEIVKINKIYTMKEIIEAVKSVIDLLD